MAHHDDENAASIGLRRGLKTLPPIQTSLDNTDSQASRWKRVRPVVPIVDQPQQPQSQQSFEPAPTLRPKPESRKLENRKSTMSLFNLFSRPKVERARGHHEAALPSTRDESPRSPAQLPPASRPSTQMDTVTVAPQPKPQPPPVKRSGSRPSTAKSGRGSLSRRARHASAWDPPPLFQAYPQAVKHAKLQAPHASTETIMKTQAHRRQYSMLQEKLESKLDLSKDAEDDAEGGDKKPEKSQRRPSLTSTLTPPDLPQKVYILTTSGHMLQYSGAGESNRLPEKVLQLGKDSAAFACDLIPGKHWVLQISQATNDDGTMTAQQPKSILSKLRMHGPTARKAATNLLMIFENPEEMGKWLVALRQEIDILAGRKSRSDADYEASNESNDMPELEKKTSHRYLVRRQSSLFSDRSPIGSPLGSPGSIGPDWAGTMRGPDTVSLSQYSSRMASKRQSYDTVANTIASQDHVTLNHLRGGSGTSMMSGRTSGTGVTMTNSRPSSRGPPSPLNGPVPNWTRDSDGQRSPTTLKSFHMNPSTASNARRRSMPLQPLVAPVEPAGTDSHYTQNKRHSTLGSGYKREQISRQHSNPSSVSSTPPRTAGATTSRRTSFSRPFNTHGDDLPPTQRSVSDSAANDTSDSLDVRRGSTLGNLPTPTTLSFHSVNRQTPSPKLGYRPIPVRSSSGAPALPRRGSSFGPALPVKPTALQQSTSQRPAATIRSPTFAPTQLQQTLRRPASMQIRSEPAFLSTRRPMGVSACPASSNTNHYSTSAPQGTSISDQSGFAQSAAAAAVSGKKPVLSPRRSMPIMSLPPPAPPPTMPLPAVPGMQGRRVLMA